MYQQQHFPWKTHKKFKPRQEKKNAPFYDEDKKRAPKNVEKTWVWLERYERGETDKYYNIVQEEEKSLLRSHLKSIRDDIIPERLEQYTKLRNKGILQIVGAGILGIFGAGVVVYTGHEGIWTLVNYMGTFITQKMLDDHVIDRTLEGYHKVLVHQQSEDVQEFQKILPEMKTDITQYTKELNTECTANARWHGTKALFSAVLSVNLLACSSWAGAAGIKNIYTSLDKAQELRSYSQAASKALNSSLLIKNQS